jgi:AraC-like DNA-binding protein
MKIIPVRQIAQKQKEQGSFEKFTIRDVKVLLGGKDLIQDLHRHDFYFLLVLQQGKGRHDIDFKPYKISNNTVFFLRPGQVHQLALKKGCTGFLIEFNSIFYHPNKEISNQRLRKASSNNYYKIDNSRFKKMLFVLTSIFHEYTERQEGYEEIIKSTLDILFIEIVRQSQKYKSTTSDAKQYTQERLEEFLGLLETNITAHKNVSDYAGMLHLSVYQLNTITKETLGKTPSELINKYIILESKRYLLATSNQVNQIAYHLGYEDISYFIRFFKKHTGYSPKSFRQKFA